MSEDPTVIWGMSAEMFTFVHVALSLAGIAAGLIVVGGLLSASRLDGATAVFLATTVATSVTGFGFPFEKLGPPHFVGMISLGFLALAIVARYPMRLQGRWRAAYVIAAASALYLNAFVGVVQTFQKFPAIKALAPTQEEPPFAIAQLILLASFGAVTVMAVRRFRPAEGATT